LIIVVGIAVLVFGLGLVNIGGPTAAAPTETASVQVYYAAQNIPQGTIITENMLGTFTLPKENEAEVMFREDEKANLVDHPARFTLEQGTLITSSMIGVGVTNEIDGPTLAWSFHIDPTMVAMAIPTNRLATAAYGVNAGAHVNVNVCMTFVDIDPAFQSVLPNYTSVMKDIFFPEADQPTISIGPSTSELPSRQGRVELDPTFQKPIYTVPSESQRPRLVCQMILQNVVVLKLGNFQLNAPVVTTTDPAATPAPAPQSETSPDIITLIVTAQDSIALNYFVYSGAVITMSLRNPSDTSRIEAQSATLTSLLTQYNISLPSKLPYGQQPRLDVLAPPLLPNDIVNAQPQQ
jgi:hypothetical protein